MGYYEFVPSYAQGQWKTLQVDTTKLPGRVAATKQAGGWNAPTLAFTEGRRGPLT